MVFLSAFANVLITSEVRRCPGCGRDGGARSDDAVSEGGVNADDSGVSQNIYMKPSSSDSENGFANSARRSDVVCGDADFGMSERNSPVREEGSRSIGGLGFGLGALS